MKKKLAFELKRIAFLLEKEAKKRTPKTYGGWPARIRAEGKKKDKSKENIQKVVDAFRGRWNGALEYAEKNKKKKQFNSLKKREEYAARTAIDKIPKWSIKKPTEVHGPEKRGPIKR